MNVSEQTVGDIKSFFGDLKEALEEMKAEGLSEDDADEIEAQATVAEGQIASKKTNWQVVKNALNEIKELLDAAREIGSTVAPMAVRVAGLLAGL